MSGCYRCTEGNEARGILARSSILIQDGGSVPGEAIAETHLHMEKAEGLSMELPNWELGLARGSNED